MLIRKRNRHVDHDYSSALYYFVTICTHNRKELFGKIQNEKIILSSMGKTAFQLWEKIEEIFGQIELDEFIIMPNHIHGIIIITNAKFASATDRSKMTLSKVIQQFKRAYTIKIRKSLNIKDKIWQRSFYDRIIRNEKELYNIRKYIQQNPLKWELEKGQVENLDI